MESWQVYHVARKKLPKGMLQSIYRRSTPMVSMWAANPDYCENTARNPLDRIRLMLEEMDAAGCGEYARWAIDYLAGPLGGRFAPMAADTASDKGTVDGEVTDIAIAMGRLADAVRAVWDVGDLSVDAIVGIKHQARELKVEVDQLLDAVGIQGGV